ncbi:MAG TPA: ferrochelatase [Bacteroidales bacterium]|nr:ferrochelatase [Bacteroidales bacterium]
MPCKVLLLVNTGTPDGPDRKSVRKYLSEFLNDPLVIDIPWLLRKVLVNLIIVPFRAPKSAQLYSRLWTPQGSPLKVNLEKLTEKLQDKLEDEYLVLGAMRYGNPSIRSALQKIPAGAELTVMPLFPQYASATTGSVIEAVKREAKSPGFNKIKFIDRFWSHPAFIEAYSEKIHEYRPESFDHVIFSYHSLPVRQLRKIHNDVDPGSCICDKEFPSHGSGCYKAACHATTRLIAGKLGLKENMLSTSFQSRLSKNWIGPFTDRVIVDLAKQGKRRILVVSPSFVSDCLETLVEIKDEYRRVFMNAGGNELIMAESLNYDKPWIEGIPKIINNPFPASIL